MTMASVTVNLLGGTTVRGGGFGSMIGALWRAGPDGPSNFFDDLFHDLQPILQQRTEPAVRQIPDAFSLGVAVDEVNALLGGAVVKGAPGICGDELAEALAP